MTFTTQKHLSRRTFLRASGITLALPWLDAMQSAFAADPAPTMRFVGILNIFGFYGTHLFPREAGKGYIATPYLQQLQPHRDDLTIISGLNHTDVRGGHSCDASFFTGAPFPTAPTFKNSISLDQIIAEKTGQQTRYPSLVLSTSDTSASYSRVGVAVPPETSPARLFAKLFINGTSAQIAEEVRRLQQGRSIMDRLLHDAKRLQQHLGAQDREKLDQYYTSVRELEQRLLQDQEYARQPKPNPGVKRIEDPAPGENTLRLGLHLEVARLALQADLTRAVTIHFGGTTKTPSAPGDSFQHHDLTHHGQDEQKLARLTLVERDLIVTWGKFLQSLKDSNDGNARLMDRTISVLGSALGSASLHHNLNLPILIAGGRFKHGQHLAHNPDTPPPLCNLWAQILHELGSEVAKFGTSTSASLAGLSV